MSERETLFDEFTAAIQADQTEEAERIALEIGGALNDIDTEQVTLAGSAAGKQQAAEERDFESFQAFHDHTATGMEAQLVRLSILTELTSMVLDPEAVDEAEVESRVEEFKQELQDVEAAVETKATETQELREEITLPAQPRLQSVEFPSDALPLRPGEKIAVAVKLLNGGDEPAEEVILSFQTDEGITIDRNDIAISTLAGGERTTESVEIAAQEAGSYRLQTRLTTHDSGRDESTTMVSVTEGTALSEDDDPDPEDDEGGGDGDSGVSISPEQLAGIGVVGAAMLYAAARMRSEGDDDEWETPPPR